MLRSTFYFVSLDLTQNEDITSTEDLVNCNSTREVFPQESQEKIIELELKNEKLQQLYNSLKTEYELRNVTHNTKVKNLQSKIQMLEKRNSELEIFEVKGDSNDREVTIFYTYSMSFLTN